MLQYSAKMNLKYKPFIFDHDAQSLLYIFDHDTWSLLHLLRFNSLVQQLVLATEVTAVI
jgi:hypothetical protein